MVMTNSTYDGLCYNIDAIKETLGDTVEVLHFDEAWYAYANFHEFYDGFHGISSHEARRARRTPITFATHSTHKLLAALSQASMIHIQNGETARLDMARFNDAFMMHTSTSPQYGIIASCDVAAAMMEQPAGRALVQETIDEALSFRRAMTAVARAASKARGGSTSGSPTRWPRQPSAGPSRLGAEARATLARLRRARREPCPGRPDQGHDPHARASGRRRHAGARHSRCRGVQVPVVPPHRDREDRPLFLPRPVLDGHHQGQVEHAGHGAPQLQGSLRRQRAAQARACRRSSKRIRKPMRRWACKDLCEQIHKVYREDNVPKAQREMYTDAARDGDAPGRRL